MKAMCKEDCFDGDYVGPNGEKGKLYSQGQIYNIDKDYVLAMHFEDENGKRLKEPLKTGPFTMPHDDPEDLKVELIQAQKEIIELQKQIIELKSKQSPGDDALAKILADEKGKKK